MIIQRLWLNWFHLFAFADSNKNKIAMNVISHLISHCCWLNVHILPSHEAVFEIRVADGYGARWSKDGTKVFYTITPVFLSVYTVFLLVKICLKVIMAENVASWLEICSSVYGWLKLLDAQLIEFGPGSLVCTPIMFFV